MIIDDNFLTQEQSKEFSDYLTSSKVLWNFNSKTVVHYENDLGVLHNQKSKDSFQFTHLVYDNGEPKSDLYITVKDIMNNFFVKNNIEFRAILRAKFNLVTNSLETQERQPVHVDYKFNHKVFLYYVNDSDGETILYNEKYTGEKVENLTELERISPKRGRAVVFDGLQYHAPTPPKISPYRIVLNVPFI